MTKAEWKEFWERVDTAAAEYDTVVYKVEADGGYRVLIEREDADNPSKESICKGILVSQARYGLRGDEGQDHYYSMLKVQWESDGPVPFGTSKTITMYVSPVPSAVFAILYV